MEKQEKVFDLKTILTQQSYIRLSNYLNKIDKFGDKNDDYGRDAFAMIGSSAKPSQVCQMFNLLADPEYINLRSDWGDITGQDNELIPDIDDFATGVKNSFAIKKNVNDFKHLDFPLFNNYMSVDGPVADIDFKTSWPEQKKLIEKSFGMKIVDNKEFDDFFEYAEEKSSKYVRLTGESGFVKNTAAKIVHLPVSMLYKIFKVVKLENKFPFKKQLAKDPNVKEKVCFVSKHFKDHDLSHLDKFVAVIDALVYEKMQKVSKIRDVKHDLKGFTEDDQRKILTASKLIADWAVCMASDLGKENHKQMDNALKLELNSVLGTLPQDNRDVTTAIANISNDLTSEMFEDMKHLNYVNIVEHRKELGVEYVDDFDLNNFASWDAMKTINPNAIDLNHVLFGKTINKSLTATKNNILYKGYSPAFNELQPDAELVENPIPTPLQINAPAPVVKTDDFVEDKEVGKVVGIIIPKGVAFADISEIDEENKIIYYNNKDGKQIACNYLAFDGENYREFINGEDFGKNLTLDEENSLVYENQNEYFGSFVKTEYLSKFKQIVEDSKNKRVIYKPLIQDSKVPAINSQRNTQTKGDQLAKSIEQSRKLREDLKIERARQKRSYQVAKNEEQRKIDDNKLKIGKYLDKKTTDFTKSSIEDKNLKQLKYLDKKSTSCMESDIEDKNLKLTKYMDKNPTIAQTSSIKDENLARTKYLNKKPNVAPKSNIENKNLKKVKYLDKKPTLSIESNVNDVNLKKSKYLDRKSTAMLGSKIEDENLKVAILLDKKNKKKNVCPKYDSEEKYQLYANGVLPELNNHKKKETKNDKLNGIIIKKEIEAQKYGKEKC